MKAIKFTLQGRTAFFKKPDVNTFLYFTYGNIHKVAILGIFGAILGYKGYNQMDKNDLYPEFYSKLSHLNISIVPNNKNGIISKKVQVFNNSVGYASEENGGNLIIKEQWLENPSWDIYVLLNNEESEKLKESLEKRRFIFIPYLGKNDHLADITDFKIVQCNEIDDFRKVDSLFIKEDFKISVDSIDDMLDLDNINKFKYEEALPIELELETNRYLFKNFIFTNNYVDIINNSNIYEVNNKVLQFI